MAKIFRKIREKLLEQSKLKNYLLYATGEIILVMIGILLALEVNNRNSFRKDRSKEKAILVELNKDFKKNLARFEEVKADQINTYNNGLVVFRNLDKMDDPVSRDSVYRHAQGVFGGYTYYPSDGVVESLISSGDFNLIQNDTLRKYLVSWNDILSRYKLHVEIDRQLWSNQIEPYIVKNGHLSELRHEKNIQLLSDPVFINLLVRKQFYNKNVVNAIEGEDGLDHYIREIERLTKTE